ncbi:hypothetical protein K6025_03035 [Ehrlichia sp. JZT12]
MREQQKLIHKMVDDCNNYKKLCKINKNITTLLKIAQNNSLLKDLSTMKQKSRSATIENNLSPTNNIDIPEKDSNSVGNKEIKNIKGVIKLKLQILMSVIAHKMDPKQRAGETAASNKRDAKKFGRSQAKVLNLQL